MPGVTALAVAVLVATAMPAPTGEEPDQPPAVTVDDGRLVDAEGEPVQLRGVNHSGAEYSCVQGHGIFDGSIDAEHIATLKTWRVNTVRVPLNEDCWLGAPDLAPALSGVSYRTAVVDYVERLTEAGLVVIVDLHWTGTEDEVAVGQKPMARAERSEEFWRSVAGAFGDREGVMFDAFNEPHDIDWECWRDGCGPYAGMQDLVDAIRSTGARQPIILSGLDWGGDLRKWREFRPHDPAGALVAGAHLYDFKRCATPECWDAEISPDTQRAPVIITEFGDSDCNGDFSARVMSWADSAQVSYVAWTWNPWDCGGGPALISGPDATPTPYGQIIRSRYRARVPPPQMPERLSGAARAK